MATFYLINTTNVGAKKYFAGDLLNDAVHATADVSAAGGILWPSSDATVASAGTLVQTKRKARAISESEADAIMAGAASKSLKAGGGDAATATTAGTMPAADKKFLDAEHAAAGANIADADGTIQLAEGAWRKIPTLTGNRSITLGVAGATPPVAGEQITITRLSTAANTAAIINGGGGAGTLYTFPASKNGFAKFQFDGTDWALREVGVGS